MNKILIVDDEQGVLSSLKRLLHKEPYEVVTALGGQAGIDAMKDNEFSIVLSDMRMPDIDGIQVLKSAKNLCPHAIRLILSGYADKDMITEAVNTGHLWRFLVKPWDADDLKITLRNALELFESNEKQRNLNVILEARNAELKALNESLEQKVQERTAELTIRSKALEMIANDTDMSPAIDYVLSALKAHFGLEELSVSETRPASGIGLAIQKSGQSLGYLVMSQADKEHEEALAPFVSLLALAISLKSYASNTDCVLKKVDSLLDEF